MWDVANGETSRALPPQDIPVGLWGAWERPGISLTQRCTDAGKSAFETGSCLEGVSPFSQEPKHLRCFGMQVSELPGKTDLPSLSPRLVYEHSLFLSH